MSSKPIEQGEFTTFFDEAKLPPKEYLRYKKTNFNQVQVFSSTTNDLKKLPVDIREKATIINVDEINEHASHVSGLSSSYLKGVLKTEKSRSKVNGYIES